METFHVVTLMYWELRIPMWDLFQPAANICDVNTKCELSCRVWLGQSEFPAEQPPWSSSGAELLPSCVLAIAGQGLHKVKAFFFLE